MDDRAIPRKTVSVTLLLSDSRSLSGEIQIDLETRLSDFMNLPGSFFVLHDRDDITRIINKAHVVELREL